MRSWIVGRMLAIMLLLPATWCFASGVNWNHIEQLSKKESPTEALRVVKDDLKLAPAAMTVLDHYNFGTLLESAGQQGAALAHLEKAHSLAPWDSAIRNNRDLARKGLSRKIGPSHLDPASNGVEVALSWISMNLLQGLIGVLVAISGAIAIRSGIRSRAGAFFVGSTALLILLALSQMGGWIREPGILLTDAVARSGPGATFADLSHLSAGIKIRLTGTVREGTKTDDSWTQAYFENERIGWIPTSAILHL